MILYMMICYLLLLRAQVNPLAFHRAFPSRPICLAQQNPSRLAMRTNEEEFFRTDTLPEIGVQIYDHNDDVALIVSPYSTIPTPSITTPTVQLDASQPGWCCTVDLDTSLPGWGSGVHPTTYLCLRFLVDLAWTSPPLKNICDYGSGSGILGIAAAKLLDPSTVVAVDIEQEALEATQANWELNNISSTLETYHAREVIPSWPISNQDLVLANILVGALCRPSMVAVLVNALKTPDVDGNNGGIICFSGILPDEMDSLMQAYGKYLAFDDDLYDSLAATDTPGSKENYGFDAGTWCRVVAHRTVGADFVADMSEAAVS